MLNRISDIVLPAVPATVWCGVVVDPATLLDTAGEHRQGFPAEVMPRLFEIEHAEQDDADSLRSLSRRAAKASALSASTGGQMATSKYYREILAPLDLADELRIVFSDGGRAWGLMVMCRDKPFTEAELAGADAARRFGVDDARPGAAAVDGDQVARPDPRRQLGDVARLAHSRDRADDDLHRAGSAGGVGGTDP